MENSEENINNILDRGVAEILPDKKELKDLLGKKKITLYQGFDPSSDKLHIGNLVGIRKLAQFQKLGHKVIFLIGDFTGMIGDPTDKTAARVRLTKEQVEKNAKSYKEQIKNVLDFEGDNAAEIKYNSEWLSKLNFGDLVDISSNFTVQQLIERDMFKKRLEENKPIYLHEFLYPIMQGYDSVFMGVDLEMGGNDQLFNMLAGRSLVKSLKDKEKYVLTVKLLEGTDGAKMGKSIGNTINLTDSPEDIFGKIMSLPDTFIEPSIELLTDLPLDTGKDNPPMETKKIVAFEIVKQLHGASKANDAKTYFEKTFQKGSPEYELKISLEENLAKTIAPHTSNASVSDAKRYIEQGSVDVNDKTIKDPIYKVKVGDKLRIGTSTFGTVVEEK